MECPECGEKVNEGTEECLECGFPFISSKEPIRCPECGKEVNEQSKNCPECGCPLETNESQESLLINCEACGNTISKWAEVCPHCGQKTVTKRKDEYSDNIIEFVIGLVTVIIFIFWFFKRCSI